VFNGIQFFILKDHIFGRRDCNGFSLQSYPGGVNFRLSGTSNQTSFTSPGSYIYIFGPQAKAKPAANFSSKAGPVITGSEMKGLTIVMLTISINPHAAKIEAAAKQSSLFIAGG
jgi:hypothetical protein